MKPSILTVIFVITLFVLLGKSLKPSNKAKFKNLKQYRLLWSFKIISEIVMETDAEIESEMLKSIPFFVEAPLPAALSTCKGHLQKFSACWLNFYKAFSSYCPKLHRSS